MRESSKNSMDKIARKIILRLQKKYPQTYLVGGAVRDMLLGKKNFDLDIATEALPAEVKRELESMGLRFFDAAEKFGTIGVPSGDGKNIEITTFRKESEYEDLRHPAKITFIASARADAKRRDFTVNSLYYDPRAHKVLDFTGGRHDLKHQKIRFVGSPETRIKEDPLRLLRAVRFASNLNFEIADKDLKSIKKHSGLASIVAPERTKAELDKIFSGENFLRGFELLDETGILKILLPEVEALKKVRQSRDFHSEGNAFIHTALILKEMKDEKLLMRYAGLLHDIGKKDTEKINFRKGSRHISFYGHAPAGAEKFETISRRLNFSRREKQQIKYLISSHMDLLNITQIREKTLVKMAKKPYFSDLLRLRIYDNIASIADKEHAKKDNSETIALKKILKKSLPWKKRMQRKLLSGREVMRILKIDEGKRVGKILEQISIQAALGKIKTKKEAEKFVKTLDNRF